MKRDGKNKKGDFLTRNILPQSSRTFANVQNPKPVKIEKPRNRSFNIKDKILSSFMKKKSISKKNEVQKSKDFILIFQCSERRKKLIETIMRKKKESTSSE